MLTRDEIRKYLDRLEYDKIPAPDLETLHALQWAHLTHVPYENIDALLGIPISLKPDDLYRKIVLEHRGGWCFELQGAYGYLLQSLGFAVMQYAARFMDEPGVVQMRRHRILVVDFNGRRYLTDVGVRSESPRKPLALVFDAIQSDGVCNYQFRKDDFYGWALWQEEKGKPWKPIYGFTEEPQIDDDFVMPSFWGEKHPDSTFNKFPKISIFSGETNRTLVGNVYKEYRDAKVQVRQVLETKEEIARVLLERFGLDARQK